MKRFATLFFNLLSFFISQQNVDSAHYTDVIMSTIASQITSRSPPDCLLNRLFRRRSKKTSKLRVTGLYVSGPMTSPHKWPVTRKMFLIGDAIMLSHCREVSYGNIFKELHFIWVYWVAGNFLGYGLMYNMINYFNCRDMWHVDNLLDI